MFQVHVSSKGQIVIPKALRERWGITEGVLVEFTEADDGLRLKVQRDTPREQIERSLEEGAGLVRVDGPSRTPAEMRAAVRAGFASAKR